MKIFFGHFYEFFSTRIKINILFQTTDHKYKYADKIISYQTEK